MRMTSKDKELEVLAFAEQAASHFAQYPKTTSYGNMKSGDYMALRWGLANDCVLVVKLDEDFVPVNFAQMIREVKL